MDAETMLNELCDIVENETRHKVRADDAGITDYLVENERKNAIRDQLLTLIRAGLALQRLEKWLDKSTRHECHCRWAVGEYVQFQFTLYDRGEADYIQKRPILTDAINAALDAAG